MADTKKLLQIELGYKFGTNGSFNGYVERAVIEAIRQAAAECGNGVGAELSWPEIRKRILALIGEEGK